MKIACEQCGCVFDATNRRGVTPKYCSNSCKQKAYRARRRRRSWGLDGFKDQRRWVRAVGKRPVMPDGSPASSTDSSTWSTFAEVQASTAGDGFGIMLGGGLGCYDIDHCFSAGVLESWAARCVDSIPEPVVFIEKSVSDTGLHVFVEAVEGRGFRKQVGSGSVERYTRARFIRVTGNVYEFTEYNSCGG